MCLDLTTLLHSSKHLAWLTRAKHTPFRSGSDGRKQSVHLPRCHSHESGANLLLKIHTQGSQPTGSPLQELSLLSRAR